MSIFSGVEPIRFVGPETDNEFGYPRLRQEPRGSR